MKYKITTTYEAMETTCGDMDNSLWDAYGLFIDPIYPTDVLDIRTSRDWMRDQKPSKKIILVNELSAKHEQIK
jgi:hypothetical protein